MKCFLLVPDLMLGSQVRSAAQQCELDLVTIKSPADVTEPGIAVVDLSAPRLDIESTINQLVSAGTTVIAIGPHVHGDKLAAAESAGAVVMSKGEAHRHLATKLKKLMAS